MRPFVHVAVEGVSDESLARRLVAEAGMEAIQVTGRRGKAQIDLNLPAYNRAAEHLPWLVLRDLDTDAECAPTLARSLLVAPARLMALCIAVRAAEAWLLGDAATFAQQFRVSREAIPARPEELDDPKRTLVNLCRRSRSKAVRDDVVPLPGGTASVGPGYVGRVGAYATGPWRPDAAASRCPSLRRALRALESVRESIRSDT